MAFQFSLASVLRVRGIVEEREERVLQRMLYEILEAVQMLSRLDTEIRDVDAQRAAERFRASSGRQIHLSYGASNELRAGQEELRLHLLKLEALRDLQIGVYAAAKQNREMLTDMRNDARRAYQTEVARRDQKTLDELYISRRGHPL